MRTGVAVGLDIGGTSIVGAVLAGEDARILARRTIPTDSRLGIADGLARLRALAESLLEEAAIPRDQLVGIGVGSTGPVDARTGQIHNPFTLPGWEGIPVVDALSAAFERPACLIGDCQAAALGEFWNGAGRGVDSLAYVTVGTGIGGGFVLGGRLYRGLGDANEVGHHTIDLNGPACYCGGRGCLEMLAAGPAIAQAAATDAPSDSLLLTLAGGVREQITAEMVTRAAGLGDPFSQALVTRIGMYLGTGIANLINILSPQMVVMGGGVMLGWDSFAPSMLATVAKRAKMVPYEQMRIAPAQLRLNAGVTGAARAIWDFCDGKL
jgi:glucokinase